MREGEEQDRQMEKQVLYYSYFKNIDEETFYLEIFKAKKREGLRPAEDGKEVFLCEDMISIERQADDVLTPITYTSVKLSLFAEKDGWYEDLADVHQNECFLRILKNNDLYFIGSLDTEQWTAPYSYLDKYAVDVTFSDFGILKRTKFKLKDYVSVYDIIEQAIKKAVQPFEFLDSPKIKVLTDFDNEDKEGGELIKFALKRDYFEDRANIDTRAFFPKDEDEEEEVYWDYVLTETLKPFGYYLEQKGGAFVLYDINSLCKKDKEELVAYGTDAEIGIDKKIDKLKVEVESNADTELLKLKDSYNYEDPLPPYYGEKVEQWQFLRTDLPYEHPSFDIEFYKDKEEKYLTEGKALWYKIKPYSLGSKELGVVFVANPYVTHDLQELLNFIDGETATRLIGKPFIKGQPIYEDNPLLRKFKPKDYKQILPTGEYAFAGNHPMGRQRKPTVLYSSEKIKVPNLGDELASNSEMSLDFDFKYSLDELLYQKVTDIATSYNNDKKLLEKLQKNIYPKESIKKAYVGVQVKAFNKGGKVIKKLSIPKGSFLSKENPILSPQWYNEAEETDGLWVTLGDSSFSLGGWNRVFDRNQYLESTYKSEGGKGFHFPTPPKGTAYIQVFITNDFKLHIGKKDKERAVYLGNACAWWMMKNFTFHIFEKRGEKQDKRKIVYSYSMSDDFVEKKEETILFDTTDKLPPSSRSSLINILNNRMSPICKRGELKGTLGELYTLHILSRSCGKHYSLRGTYKTPKNGTCLLRDPHKKIDFKIVKQDENPIMGTSHLEMVEVNKDSSYIKGTNEKIRIESKHKDEDTIDPFFLQKIRDNIREDVKEYDFLKVPTTEEIRETLYDEGFIKDVTFDLGKDTAFLEKIKGKDGSKIAGILSRENKEPSYWNKWGEVGVATNWSGLENLQPKVGDLIYIMGTDSEGNARQIVVKYREDKQAETIAHTITKRGDKGKDGKSTDFLDLYAKKIKGGAISRDPRPAIDIPWNSRWMSNEYGNINYHDTGIKLTSKGIEPYKRTDTWEGRPANVGVWIDNATWDKEAVGKTYYTKFIAKIPKGITIEYVNRNYGGECKWLTPTIGTDEYETYIYKVEYKAKANNGSFYFSTLDQQARKFDVYIKQIDLFEEDLTKRLEQSVSYNLEQLLGQSDKFQQSVTNSLYKKGIASKVADKLGQNASFRGTLEQEMLSSEDLQEKIKAQSSKTLKEITLDPNFLNTLKFTIRTCTPGGTVIQDPELIDFLKGMDNGLNSGDMSLPQLHIGGIPQTCQSYSKTLPELLYEQQKEILRLKSGHREKVFNLINHPSSIYNVRDDDFYIVARSTGNGDRNPLIRFSDTNLPTFGVWKIYHFSDYPSVEIRGDVNVYGIVNTARFDLERGYEYTLRKTEGSWWQVTRIRIS